MVVYRDGIIFNMRSNGFKCTDGWHGYMTEDVVSKHGGLR